MDAIQGPLDSISVIVAYGQYPRFDVGRAADKLIDLQGFTGAPLLYTYTVFNGSDPRNSCAMEVASDLPFDPREWT